MKWLKRILGALLIVFLAIQIVPRNQLRSYEEVSENDLTRTVKIPEEVNKILKTSCYDCHSSKTRYPWYYTIQPLGLYIDDHIEKGVNKLNFSEFGGYSPRRQRSKLRSSLNQIKDGEMPLSSYTFIHHEAQLTDDELKVLEEWINSILDDTSS